MRRSTGWARTSSWHTRRNPPYVRIVDDLTTIREFLRQDDPRMSGLKEALTQSAGIRIEQVSEIAEWMKELVSLPPLGSPRRHI